jgi:predicted transcriptional regulator
MNLKLQRNALGISQSRLARLASVSRFKICMFELGDGRLNEEELNQISSALREEAQRLRDLSLLVDFTHQSAGMDVRARVG